MRSKRKSFRATFTISVILLLTLAVFLTSVMSNLGGAHVDLTEDQIFTMSPAAARILSGLSVPVQVNFFVTPAAEMPTGLQTLERAISVKCRD